MDTLLPAFIDAEEQEQAQEIRTFLKEQGADLKEESITPLQDELAEILECCQVCFKEDAELESVMNSILSLVLVVPEKRNELIKKCCDKLKANMSEDENSSAAARLRVLSVLFSGLPEKDPMRHEVYCTQLTIAAKASLVDDIPTELELVKGWLGLWDVDADQRRQVFRLLHGALHDEKRSEEASKVMIELLSTYTDENASAAREDAKSCVVSCLTKPNVLIMDNILSLKPVAVLQGDPIYQLLQIFVSGDVQDYKKFYDSNTDFINSIGLSHEMNLKKMRVLTLMSIGKETDEISYEDLATKLGISSDEIEQFLIEAIQTGLVKARLDQVHRKVIISSVAQRTFGINQWQNLHSRLVKWRDNLLSVRGGLQSVVPPITV
ncbi:predicted protein [Nematostella vectensis]|uniref:Eukaryotic translation initiation factor 3 subunit M n=1 Tax=Nematostella vectensis TaxID=45351 RepID=EIF3M_NEMVE|nr:eukaryotic translation initiation factor 3 subunit M [Nematostella vectensis]A7SPX9.1 RecName: Full=Eukaryotic translation initiation factor 3 subunit M; Short=eIF3m [Nematostella vectensis]EDO34250.1 predicted protein [Nematostella vectensis]|eukprot:XP_001626350.1 predicted protein [Nematostella vectensis]